MADQPNQFTQPGWVEVDGAQPFPSGRRSGRGPRSRRTHEFRPPAGFPPLADDDPAPSDGSPPPVASAESAGGGGRPRPRERALVDGSGEGRTPRQYTQGLPTPTLRFPARPSDGTGFALGLVLYVVGLCYIRGGWTGPGGVRDWGRAKFFNQTTSGGWPGGGAGDFGSTPPPTTKGGTW